MPALIAGSVNLLAFSGALAQAGIVGRFDADRGILVIEPANAREHDAADARIGIAWWNGLTPTRRRYWLDVAGSARPADAWRGGCRGRRRERRAARERPERGVFVCDAGPSAAVRDRFTLSAIGV